MDKVESGECMFYFVVDDVEEKSKEVEKVGGKTLRGRQRFQKQVGTLSSTTSPEMSWDHSCR